jgi:predicted oxidoreductase
MNTLRAPISQQGPDVSAFIAGFWRLKHWEMKPQALLKYMEKLLELGISTMDHAMVYGSEAPFGDALALKPSLRDKIEIVTKFGIRPVGFGPLGAQKVNHYDASATAMAESVDASLGNLRSDYIDILLIHRPDYLMHVDEMAEAFARLKAQGKVRYFGVSNFSPAQFDTLQNVWRDGLVTNQIEFSPYHMQHLDSGVFEQSVKMAARPMLWSCLAGGLLLAPCDHKGERILQAVKLVQEEIGAETVEQVIYAWILALPCKPLPLLGSSKIERIENAVKSLNYTLTREQWYRIWEASNGAPVP